jgi:hypothetical protein
MSYRSNWHFILVEWFLAELWPLGFEIWQIFSCHHFFSLCLKILTWFLVWVYNDELQIKLTFRSGPMIFGPWTWNLAKYLVVTILFHWFEILTWFFGLRVYNDKLQINFEIHSGWMIFDQLTAVGLWNLAKYLVFTTFFSLWFEILTWLLVCECRVMSYQSILNFVVIEWCWANLRTFEILTLFLVFGITMMSYRSSFIGIGLLIHMQVL